MNDCIKYHLRIKDPNLHFYAWGDEEVHKRVAMVYHAILDLPVKVCPHCGSPKIVKYGYAPVMTSYPSTDEMKPTFLAIKKQRIRCRACGRTTAAVTDLVKPHHQISNRSCQKALSMLQEDISQKTVAALCGTSSSTVCRLLDSPDLCAITAPTLPENLAIDEFRGPRREFCFIIVNNDTSEVHQVLPSREKRAILNYFERHYSFLERCQVKTVSLDLNAYYQDVVRRLFPNADLIIDRFHVVAMLTRAFNQTRTQVMRQYAKATREYRLLKFDWRLYLMKSGKLNYTHEFYDRHLRQKVTQAERVDLGLGLSPTLDAAYDLMQGVMAALDDHDYDRLTDLIFTKWDLGEPFKTVLKSLRHNIEAVHNAAILPYSNGRIEGDNRMIKQLQRISYGLRNFNHLVARIRLRQMRTLAEKRHSQAMLKSA